MSQMFSFCGLYLLLADTLAVEGQIQYLDQVTTESTLVCEILCLD